MKTALITGSAGLIGAESVRFFSGKDFRVIGIDNDMRQYFFGPDASTSWQRRQLEETIPHYRHYPTDIRDYTALQKIFSEYGRDIQIIIHTAAQPSHDWAAREPLTDFSVNATGTLNMLECGRLHCPEAVFIFTSTNKVYGDTPNRLPLLEQETRFEVAPEHPFHEAGIDESMSLDQSLHSLFGAAKVAADVLVQEYGRYFSMKTAVFRGGCLTGPGHSGAQLHGFVAYLMRCAVLQEPYTIFGYQGKQVRDNIHAFDLVNMFWHFFQAPRRGEVYNAGGSRFSNCSVLEAIALCEQLTDRKMKVAYSEGNRSGDHIWYISDIRKFRRHFPQWEYRYNLKDIFLQVYQGLCQRLIPEQR